MFRIIASLEKVWMNFFPKAKGSCLRKNLIRRQELILILLLGETHEIWQLLELGFNRERPDQRFFWGEFFWYGSFLGGIVGIFFGIKHHFFGIFGLLRFLLGSFLLPQLCGWNNNGYNKHQL